MRGLSAVAAPAESQKKMEFYGSSTRVIDNAEPSPYNGFKESFYLRVFRKGTAK